MARRGARLGQSVLDLDIDDSRFHSKLSGAYKAANQFTETAGAGLQKAGKAISGVGTAWTRNITLPILAAGGAAAKMGLDFDTTFRQIVGLTDVSADQVDGLKEKVLALGPAVGKGPQELAEALYFVVSAGFDAEEGLLVLETAAKAAATGLGDTQTVAKVLGSVINAYGHENITAAQAADQLTAAVKDGTAEASDYAGVLGRVVPSAAAMSVSFDQVTAALAAMTLTGLSAEEAATGLNQVFVSLLKPTTQAESALAGMGLSAEGLRRQLKEQGLLSVLRTLEERFRGNDAAAAAVFGNVRALRTVTALLALDTDQLNKVFADTANSAGLAGAAFETVAEGPGFKMQQSMARIQAAGIRLGDDILPLVATVLDEVANHAADLAEWWDSLDQGTKDLIVRVLALTATVGPLLIVLGKLTSGLGYLFQGVAALTRPGSVGKLTGLLGKVGLAGAAVVVAVALQEASKQAAGFFQEIIHGKKAVAEVKTLAELLQDLGDFAGPAASSLYELGITADELAHAIEAAGGDVELAAKTILENNGDVARSIGELRAAAGGLVDDASFEKWDRQAQRALHGVQGAVAETALQAELEAAGIPADVAAAMAAGAGEVEGGAEDMLAGIEEEARKAREAAIQHMKALLAGIANLFDSDETLRTAFQDLLDRMDDPYTEAERRADIFSRRTIQVIRGALQSGDPKIVSDTKDLVNNMLEQVEAMEPGALAAGTAVPPAIRAGMDAQVDDLITWIEDNVTHESLTALDLNEAEELGLTGIYLYAKGMERNQRLAEDAARAVRMAAMKPLEEGVGASERLGGDTGAGFGTGIRAQPNIEKARTAGDTLARTARWAMWWDAYTAGQSIGASWGAGLASSFTTVERDLGFRMGEIRALMGGSLPTKGPLTHPQTGGATIGRTWIDALASALDGGVRAIQTSVGGVSDALAYAPDLTAPISSSTSALAMPGAGVVGAPAIATAREIHYTWVLQLNGLEKRLSSDEQLLKELRDLSLFGDGRVQG